MSAPVDVPRIGKEARGGNCCARKHPPPDSVPAAQGNQSASGCLGCTLGVCYHGYHGGGFRASFGGAWIHESRMKNLVAFLKKPFSNIENHCFLALQGNRMQTSNTLLLAAATQARTHADTRRPGARHAERQGRTGTQTRSEARSDAPRTGLQRRPARTRAQRRPQN